MAVGRSQDGNGGEGQRFEALFALLVSPDGQVRLSAAETLTTLPLVPQEWLQLADWAHAALDHGESAFEIAAKIPVRSVREHLAQIAEAGGPNALAAAGSLASVQDGRGAPVLLAAARDGSEWAAQQLAGIDLSGHLQELREVLAAVPRPPVPQGSGTEESRNAGYAAGSAGSRRFWLALALARNGDDSELRAFLDDEREGRALADIFFGQPEVWWAAITAGGAVPEALAHRAPAG
jgi:hypothetical protein